MALAVSHASSAKACEVGLELGVTSLPRRLPTLRKCGKPRLYGAGPVYSSALQLSSFPCHHHTSSELELTVQVSLWPPISVIRAEIRESGRMALSPAGRVLR
jgi:hypothetical protein